MEHLILQSKLIIPAEQPAFIHRPRLYDLLAQALDHKVTIICAPAGYGKTTLISRWLGQQSIPAAWLSLDKWDSDINRFVAYMMSALQCINHEFCARTFELYQSEASPQFEHVMTCLGRDLEEITSHCLLVLDDYHLVENTEIDQLLEFITRHINTNLRIILSSRKLPSIPLARLRAHQELLELTETELRFRLDELVLYLEQARGVTLQADELRKLEEQTEGWIALVQLATNRIKKHGETLSTITLLEQNNELIADFLMEEVFDELPSDIQNFLVHTSFLNRLSDALCNAVLMIDNAATIIKHLAKEHFLLSASDDEQWMQYHALFADYLARNHLAQETAEVRLNLYHRAIDWHESHGRYEEAIIYAIEIGSYEQAAQLITKSIEHYNRIWGAFELLGAVAHYVGKLPEDYLQAGSKPWFHYWGNNISVNKRGYVRDPYPGITSPKDQGDAAFAALPEYRQKRVLTIKGAYELDCQGDTLQALRYQDRSRAYVLENMEDSFIEVATASFAAAAALSHGNLHDARAVFNRIPSSSEDRHGQLFVKTEWAELIAQEGHLKQAEMLHQAAIEYAEEKLYANHQLVSRSWVGLGNIYYEWNRLEDSERAIRKGLQRANVSSLMEYCIPANIALLQNLCTQQKWEAASRALDEFERILEANLYPPQGVRCLAALHTLLELTQKHPIGDVQWVEPLLTLSYEQLNTYEQFALTVYARVLVAREEYMLAQELMQGLLARYQRHNQQWKAISIMPWLAHLLVRNGEPESALHMINAAVSMAEEERVLRSFLDAGPTVGEQIGRLLQQHILAKTLQYEVTPAYLSTLLKAFKTDAASLTRETGVPIEGTGFHLTEREIEILQLVAQGYSNQGIAETLVIELSTVKWHTGNIYSKLGVTRRSQAIKLAKGLNIIPW